MDEVKLFQVKDVCKTCGITRKALLVYEGKGLLTPHFVNADSGYRYYNAENIAKIMYIKRFQSFGFSLDEIGEYLRDTNKLSAVVDRLTKLKNEVEESIAQLKMRMMTEENDRQQIVRIVLPRLSCYAKRAVTHGYAEVVDFLREVHLEAIKANRAATLSDQYKLHSLVLSYEGDSPDVYGTCDMLHCIAMKDGYDGANARVEEERDAVALFHRGSYATLKDSAKTLLDYCAASGIRATGPMCFNWLEGPPQHGAAEEKYLTQISIPI